MTQLQKRVPMQGGIVTGNTLDVWGRVWGDVWGKTWGGVASIAQAVHPSVDVQLRVPLGSIPTDISNKRVTGVITELSTKRVAGVITELSTKRVAGVITEVSTKRVPKVDPPDFV